MLQYFSTSVENGRKPIGFANFGVECKKCKLNIDWPMYVLICSSILFVHGFQQVVLIPICPSIYYRNTLSHWHIRATLLFES